MIKTGIIGFGKMGKIRAKAIEASGKGVVSMVYDPVEGDSPYLMAKSADEVIGAEQLDAVFVCTPNYQIQPLIIQALNAGKHVFSEKPPAFNAAGVEAIRDAEANAKGKKLMYGFNHRHHGSIQQIKSIVDSKEMGDILWMRGRYGKNVDETFFDQWRAKKELVGGGIMLDQGIHMLDLFLYLAGDFDEVSAFVSNLYWKIEGIEDNVFANFRSSKTGVCASLHSTMTQWRHLFSLEIFLAGGYLVLNGLKTSSGAYGPEELTIKRNETVSSPVVSWDTEQKVTYHTDDSWNSEIAHFFRAINNDTAVELGNSADALRLMRVMDKIYKE